MKHVCVIGGGGFIGRQLVKQLLKSGRFVSVIGRKKISPFDHSVNYVTNQENNPALAIEQLTGVNEIIDLSYTTTPQTSFENPIKDIVDNLQVTVELFKKLAVCNIQKLVY